MPLHMSLPDRFRKTASVQTGVVSIPDPGTMTGNRSTFSSPVVSILENWYSKLLVKLRWGSCFYTAFQWHLVSPSFNIFINMFVVRLHQLDIRCHINSLFIGCLLYAPTTHCIVMVKIII